MEIHRAIRKYFPEAILRDVQLPPLEDLINTEDLMPWRLWAEAEGAHKSLIQPEARPTGWAALAAGKQRGATGSARALPAVIGFGMDV